MNSKITKIFQELQNSIALANEELLSQLIGPLVISQEEEVLDQVIHNLIDFNNNFSREEGDEKEFFFVKIGLGKVKIEEIFSYERIEDFKDMNLKYGIILNEDPSNSTPISNKKVWFDCEEERELNYLKIDKILNL